MAGLKAPAPLAPAASGGWPRTITFSGPKRAVKKLSGMKKVTRGKRA